MNLKQSFEEKASKAMIDSVLSLLEKNPSKNVPKILKILKHISKDDNIKNLLKNIDTLYNSNKNFKLYIQNSLDHINPEILKSIFTNAANSALQKNNNNASYALKEKDSQVPFSLVLGPYEYPCSDQTDSYSKITFHDLDKALAEARDLGIYFIGIIEYDAFKKDSMFDLYHKYSDMTFAVFTRGLDFSCSAINKLLAVKNVIPIIEINDINRTDNDLDKTYENDDYSTILDGMDKLNFCKIPFGIHSSLNDDNINNLLSENFIDTIISKNSLFSIYSMNFSSLFRQENLSSLSKSNCRLLKSTVSYFRKTKPYLFIDLFNDYEYLENIFNSAYTKETIIKNANKFCTHIAFDSLKNNSLIDLIQYHPV